jgi:hypothetical protein
MLGYECVANIIGLQNSIISISVKNPGLLLIYVILLNCFCKVSRLII